MFFDNYQQLRPIPSSSLPPAPCASFNIYMDCCSNSPARPCPSTLPNGHFAGLDGCQPKMEKTASIHTIHTAFKNGERLSQS